MNYSYDIVVIGSGPGGYTAAIRAAQLGYHTAIIEKYSQLGGTCTNVGCIPAKALLDSTEHYHIARTKFEQHGIHLENLSMNFERLMERKKNVVEQNVSGLGYLMRKNKITVYVGHASFLNDHAVRIASKDGEPKVITGSYFIIATGSKPSVLAGVRPDKNAIITSTEALSLKAIPESMTIIGGGAIGVEMASIFGRIGTNVTVIEYADQIIPTMDRALGKELDKLLSRSGIEIKTAHQVQSAVHEDGQVTIRYKDPSGATGEHRSEYCLVAVGRSPYTDKLGLENTRVQRDEKGRIQTDQQLRTAAEHIFAIGDVIAGPMLAHKAEEEAVYVVETIKGIQTHLDYKLIPSIVYTWPEVASVGFTKEELAAQGKAYRTGKFPFMASGRARAAMEPDGFVKIISEPQYGELLGAHIIGPRAADLIAMCVAGIHFETIDTDMFKMPYAHPTYAEAIKEACLMASGQGALNI